MSLHPAVAIQSCSLTLVGEGDWFTIERAEHDNEFGLEPTDDPDCHAVTYTGRISDADVEGSAEEMLSIAEAIEKRGSCSFKRCAVSVEGDIVRFRSPRNSMRSGIVRLEDADALAAEIRAKLGGVKKSTKRLYTVEVRTKVVVLADSKNEAEGIAGAAATDALIQAFDVEAADFLDCPPGWDGSACPLSRLEDEDDEDVTIDEWVARGAALQKVEASS